MKISIEQFELVQKYLGNEMTGAEERAFEKELETNKDLKDYYLFEVDLNNALADTEFKKLYPEIDLNEIANKEIYPETKNKIGLIGEKWKLEKEKSSLKVASLQNTLQEKTIKKPLSLKLWLSIAAAACLIGLVIYITLPNTQTKETHNIVLSKRDSSFENKDSLSSMAKNNTVDSTNNRNTLAVKPTVDLNSIGNENYKKDNLPEEMPDKLVASLDDYKNGNYNTLEEQNLETINEKPKINLENTNSHTYDADESLHKLGTNDINSDQNIKELGHYYKGLAFIETKKNDEAKKNLQWVVDSTTINEDLIIKANWYLAITYLRENNKNDALNFLEKVAENKELSSYSKKAKAILKKLK